MGEGQIAVAGLLPQTTKLADGPRVPHHEIRALAPPEACRLLEAAKGHRLEALVTLAVAIGLRQGEALGLRWDAVDFEAGKLHVRTALQRVAGQFELVEPKTERSRRTIPLPEVALAALREHRKSQLEERLSAGPYWGDELGLVFTSVTGWPLHGPEVPRTFQRILAKGMPATHALP